MGLAYHKPRQVEEIYAVIYIAVAAGDVTIVDTDNGDRVSTTARLSGDV